MVTEVTAEVKNGMLVISVPIQTTPEKSKSGKNLTIASSFGIQKVPVTLNGKKQVVSIGANAFVPV